MIIATLVEISLFICPAPEDASHCLPQLEVTGLGAQKLWRKTIALEPSGANGINLKTKPGAGPAG